MKKIKLTWILIFLFFIQGHSQVPCNKMPSTQFVLTTLQHKPVSMYPGHYALGCNVNDSIKNRLLYLLIPKWTKDEIEDYITKKVRKNYEWYNIEKTAKSVSKGNDSLNKVSVDSLITIWKEYERKQFYEQNLERVDGGLLKTTAFLDIKEAVPVIKKYFNSYNKDFAILCLARLGNTALQKEIIKSCSYNTLAIGADWNKNFTSTAKKLCFIATQESIAELESWMDSTKTFLPSAHSGPGKGFKCAGLVIDCLSHILLNKDFLDLIKPVNEIGEIYYGMIDNSLIEACKKWLKRNKGKYKINRKYYFG
jgi:hypothetical protein